MEYIKNLFNKGIDYSKKGVDYTKTNKLKIKYASTKWSRVLFRTIFLLGMGFVMLYPILFMLSSAFQSLNDVHDFSVIWIPREFSMQPMSIAFNQVNFINALGVTAFIMVPSVVLQIISTLLVSYGFARFRFPGQGFLFGILIFQIIVPVTAIVIPLYVITFNLGMIGHAAIMWTMALGATGIRSALYIFIVRQFFKNIPKELEEAAMIDGCGPLKTFARIMVPNVVPAIVTITAFSAVWYWNDFFTTSMLASRGTTQTLTIALTMLNSGLSSAGAVTGSGPGQEEINIMRDAIMASGGLLVVAPLIIMYIFLQRYLTESVEKTGLVG